MKINIEFDERDRECIEEIRDGKGFNLLNRNSTHFAVEFEIHDWAKSELFLGYLFANKEFRKQLEELSGCNVSQITWMGFKDLKIGSEFKEKLLQLIEEFS